MKSSTICGSDIRCIYHEHLGKGPEGYQPGMIAGHEPCGQIVEAGAGCRRFKKGDRVIVYHIFIFDNQRITMTQTILGRNPNLNLLVTIRIYREYTHPCVYHAGR